MSNLKNLIGKFAEATDNTGEILIKEAKGKYDHIDFSITPAMRAAAKRGLEARKKAKKSNKGGLSTTQASSAGVGSGVARARDIINGKQLSPSTWKRVHAFFSRHKKNIDKASGERAENSRAMQAALLWGGRAGAARARKIVRQMDAADKNK